jgi:elongation factor Ts
MIELNCETDFVARTDAFKNLARDVAIAVAGHDTVLYVSRDDIPSEVLESQREAFAVEARDEGKPADRVAEIAEGKLNKWLEAACLMELQYRDTDRKISDLITEKIALLGENIRVARFVRMAVGEDGSGQPGSGAGAA